MPANSLTSLPCFHCGLPAITGFEAEIQGEQQAFCCPGCRAVARLIHDSGLGNFYQYRDSVPFEVPVFSGADGNLDVEKLKIYDDLDYQQDFVRDASPDDIGDVDRLGSADRAARVARLRIEGMNCSACAWLIEKRLEKVAGVVEARVNYSQRTLHLHWHPDATPLSNILAHVCALGFDLSAPSKSSNATALRAENQLFLRRIGVAGIGMMQVGMYAMAGYFGATDAMLGVLRFASLLIATLVIFYAACPFFLGAWKAIRHFYLTMDVPVALALGLAYVASVSATWSASTSNLASNLVSAQTEVYFDAICMFTFFLLVSRYLEFRVRSRWQENSMDRESGKFATLLNDAGDQNRVLSRILRRGERILVKTGEIFPVDAELLSVQAEISQAQLNGEFAPQSKQPGDEISSGSLNLGGPLEAMVLRATDQSVMARIRTLVENAQLHKPQISTLADQISGYFVAVVLGLGLLTYLYWAAVDPARAFWISISVLVVSCPCALSLATPTTLTVLMNHLSNQGILVRNSKALEKLQQVDRVIFDKTGTLTFGQFCLDVTRDFSGEGIALQQQRAAALESKSPHPLANAFHNISHSFEVSAWQMIEGRGIEAKIDGQRMRIGDSAFVSELSSRASQASQGTNSTTAVADVEQRGQPSGEQEEEHKYLYLGDENRMLAAFGLRDQIRPEAGDLVRSLISQLGDKSVLVFSGDHSAQVDWLGKSLGVSEVYKGMSAADKLAKLDENRRQGVTVLAVGDGINDGPILAAADVSVAVCNASDISKQTADFVLVTSDLLAIQRLRESAHQGRKIIIQNLSWALGYNLSAIPLAMMGLVPPWLAALGMSASSAVVVLNAFRAGARPKVKRPSKNEFESALQC